MSQSIQNYFEETVIKNKRLPVEWQSQNALNELAEFLQANWEERSVFFDDGEIASRQQFLSFTGQQGIRTNNYIGTITFKGQQLNIFPKVFREERDDNDTDDLQLSHMMKNLVQWLNYCNRISYPFINITSKLDDSNDLREFFITLYVHYLKKALDYGPYYKYVDKEEDISTIKGRINIKDYVIKKLPNGMNNVFNCSFSEFELDNKLNRILKYTSKMLLNITTSKENKNLIRNILIRLNDVSDVRCLPSECNSIRLSKLHRQYAVLLGMSKMFLLNQTTSYELDTTESFCFLFPTELLFEGFIGGFMGEVLEGKGRVRLQASELMLINDILYEGESLGKAFRMKHDILVEHKEKGVFVLDTKYKHMSRFSGNPDVKYTVVDEVEQDDLYQIIEYAAHRELDSAYLLYPMYRYEDDEPSDVVLERKSQSGKLIYIHIVRLPFIFEENIDTTKDSLRKTLLKIF